MKIEIDQHSGYCFGVEFAIQMAEDEMTDRGELFCLGDIVHNDMEVSRLYDLGLRTITREEMSQLKDCRVLIRAHGEPPETYELALRNNIELIDASCPVVLKLQNRIKHAYDKTTEQRGQVVIYGKPGHAEVVGLTGQTNNEAIVVSGIEDLNQVDFTKPVTLFSQTTKSTKGFYEIREEIERRIAQHKPQMEESDFQANDSICRQVSNREPKMLEFSSSHDVVLFVAGKKSSNGKALFQVCKQHNPKSFFIENKSEIDLDWFDVSDHVGICGATSTPRWLMEEVANFLATSFDSECSPHNQI